MRHRYILIHYHIFKNAGTTIAWALERAFGHSYRSVDEDFDHGRVPTSELVRFVKQNRQVAALSGHLFCLPAPKHERYRFLELCFLRHPLDRLQSAYHYTRRLEDTGDINVAQARALSLPDYLLWLQENQPYNLINVQTCVLGNRGRYFYPPSPHHLQRAIACMCELAVLGIVERFDDGLIAGEFYLRPVFPDLDLSYVSQQVRPGRPATLAERLDEMRKQCGDDLYRKLETWNDLDLQLLEAAEAEFERRFQFIPHREQRRHDFYARCDALRDHRMTA